MTETQDVNTLKRRGRRRLVGAVALVLVAVIVLPMVFDREPVRAPSQVSVRIPREDGAGFSPRVIAKSPDRAVAPEKPAVATVAPSAPAKSPVTSPESVQATSPSRAGETPAQVTAAGKKRSEAEERRRAERALAGGAEFIVPVAALADPTKLKELTAKLAAAKVPYYTEPVSTPKGKVTRVRAGPFGTRESANKALETIRALGLKPGGVTNKS